MTTADCIVAEDILDKHAYRFYDAHELRSMSPPAFTALQLLDTLVASKICEQRGTGQIGTHRRVPKTQPSRARQRLRGNRVVAGGPSGAGPAH